jgi:hypothetical protein
MAAMDVNGAMDCAIIVGGSRGDVLISTSRQTGENDVHNHSAFYVFSTTIQSIVEGKREKQRKKKKSTVDGILSGELVGLF